MELLCERTLRWRPEYAWVQCSESWLAVSAMSAAKLWTSFVHAVLRVDAASCIQRQRLSFSPPTTRTHFKKSYSSISRQQSTKWANSSLPICFNRAYKFCGAFIRRIPERRRDKATPNDRGRSARQGASISRCFIRLTTLNRELVAARDFARSLRIASRVDFDFLVRSLRDVGLLTANVYASTCIHTLDSETSAFPGRSNPTLAPFAWRCFDALRSLASLDNGFAQANLQTQQVR